jgi:hypothetical protein
LGVKVILILLDLRKSFLLVTALTEAFSISYVVPLCGAALISASFAARKSVVFDVFGHDSLLSWRILEHILAKRCAQRDI